MEPCLPWTLKDHHDHERYQEKLSIFLSKFPSLPIVKCEMGLGLMGLPVLAGGSIQQAAALNFVDLYCSLSIFAGHSAEKNCIDE
jgi:hypothetical protein